MKYEQLTVVQLKNLCKERNLKTSTHNHRLTKAELIESLRDYDVDLDSWDEEDEEETIVKNILEGKAEEKADSCKSEIEHMKKENIPVSRKTVEELSESNVEKIKNATGEKNCPTFAETMKEIEDKYLVQKPDWVYERELHEGAEVVFVQVVETKSGKFVKKLRRAKVQTVNFEKKEIEVKMFFGDVIRLGFEELMYIRGDDTYKLPMDVQKFLRKQSLESKKEYRDEQRRKEMSTDS